MAVAKRGVFVSVVDRVFGWLSGLSPERCSYSVTSLRVPVEEKVKLAAYLYRPVDFHPLGTVLMRTPYGIDFPYSSFYAGVFAARGYQVLHSSCRGTSGSDGEVEPARYDAADGQATVAWMREQIWYTGCFATMGPSYLGYVQWALLSDPPKDMKTAIIKTGPIDFGDFVWETGALSSNIIAWADTTGRLNRGDSTISTLLAVRSQQTRLRPVYDAVPLIETLDDYFEDKTPAWLREKLLDPGRLGEHWKPLQQKRALEKASIPILLTTGWDDILLRNVMEQYRVLLKRDCDVSLTIGPWSHLDAGGTQTYPETLAWLDQHLADRTVEKRLPVRVFVTGRREWRDLPRWPPPSTPLELFLAPEKKLAREPPTQNSKSSFELDAGDPTPSVAVPLLFDNGKGRNESDESLAKRSDVLVFETEPLDQDVEVCGEPWVELHHSTSHEHADIWVLLSDVSRAKSRSITERYIRLSPNRGSDPLRLDLADCGHVFCKGNRIRLLVAGASHPRYIRNLGTGQDPVRGSNCQNARHTVEYGASALSRLVLPITK